jgi:hypothetical protein
MPPKKPKKETFAAESQAVAVWTRAAWYVGAALVFWSFGYTTMRGSDLWWHIAGGRWMWEHGTVWVSDPFSFTAAGKEWLNDAWLSGVTLYLWSRWINLATLAYWKWLMVVVTWLLLFRLAWRLSGDAVAAFLACLLSIAVAAPFLDVRPQLYSFFCWVVLLDMCIARARPSRWLPLVMLLWVNLHAGFFLGLICLPILLLPRFLAADASGRREVAILALAGAAACLLNPNGLEVVTRPLLHAFDTDSPFRTLGEWLPPFRPGGIQSPLFPYGIGAFALAGLVTLWQLRRSRDVGPLVRLALAGLTLAMALQSRRFVPFFAITEVLVIAPALALLTSALRRWLPAYAPAVAVVALGLWWMSAQPLSTYAFDDLTARDTFPIDTCDFINVNELGGRVFAYYNWGGFLQMCTNGRMKIFIDGRAETVYDDQTFLDYMKVLQQKPGWERVVQASGAEYFLWPSSSAAAITALLEEGGWRLLYQDTVSALLARVDLGLPADFKPTGDTPHHHATLGAQFLRAGRGADAAPYFERALALNPRLETACVGLVRSRAMAGEFDAAYAAADRCGAAIPAFGKSGALRRLVDAIRTKTSPGGFRGGA